MNGQKRTVAATVARYAAATHPFTEGQLRTMTWKTLDNVTQYDIDCRTERGRMWISRAEGYWHRQCVKYGVVVGAYSIMVDKISSTETVLSTAAPIIHVMPGVRV